MREEWCLCQGLSLRKFYSYPPRHDIRHGVLIYVVHALIPTPAGLPPSSYPRDRHMRLWSRTCLSFPAASVKGFVFGRRKDGRFRSRQRPETNPIGTCGKPSRPTCFLCRCFVLIGPRHRGSLCPATVSSLVVHAQHTLSRLRSRLQSWTDAKRVTTTEVGTIVLEV